jgi:AraC-like DNA-binding protein
MRFHIPAHSHINIQQPPFKILFFLTGGIHHKVDNLTTEAIENGDILIVPQSSSHTYFNPDLKIPKTLHVIRFFFDEAVIKRSRKKRIKYPELDVADFLAHNFTEPHLLKGQVKGAIEEKIARLRVESESRQIGHCHNARSTCIDLVVDLARKLNPTRDSDNGSIKGMGGTIVSTAKEYILKHLHEPITRLDIARQTGKGEEYLSRIFKQESGQNLFDYVREMRIARAKTYLVDPSLSLAQIAERCGFSSISFFSRTFRDVCGCTPSFYRAQLETIVTNAPPPRQTRQQPRLHHLL